MTADFLLPLISSLAWLIIAGIALVSFRLGWGLMVRMALVWIAIFAGLFLIVEWFLAVRGTTSAPLYI